MKAPAALYEIPMPQEFPPSRFFMACCPSFTSGRTFSMRPFETEACCSIRNTKELRRAHAITPDLLSDVIAQACTRFAAHGATAKAKIDPLLKSGAWTDATLALLELELPHWKLRRLIYEDGEWLCSLSNQPRLPLDLDDVAEASHETLPLAILIAFLEARRVAAASANSCDHSSPNYDKPSHAVCCDNFA